MTANVVPLRPLGARGWALKLAWLAVRAPFIAALLVSTGISFTVTYGLGIPAARAAGFIDRHYRRWATFDDIRRRVAVMKPPTK